MDKTASPSGIRVLIVDDHPLVRQGIATFIEAQDDMNWRAKHRMGRRQLPKSGRLIPTSC